jgi:hypothetical protein
MRPNASLIDVNPITLIITRPRDPKLMTITFTSGRVNDEVRQPMIDLRQKSNNHI